MEMKAANIEVTETELDEALARAVRQLITEAIEAEAATAA